MGGITPVYLGHSEFQLHCVTVVFLYKASYVSGVPSPVPTLVWWPNTSCAKFPNTFIANTHVVWLTPYRVCAVGSKLIWTKAHVTLRYHKAFCFNLKNEHWMSCNLLKDHILNFHQNNHQISKLFLKSTNVSNNYFRPCNKATIKMFRIHLELKSFF